MSAVLDSASPAIGASEPAWRRLVDRASMPYRSAGRFAWHFSRGKLGLDPVFRHLVASGLIAPKARVLDLGCGQGLLASLLQACTAMHDAGAWPREWPVAPADARITGIELMPRDVERARAALGASASSTFICGDMRREPFPVSDAVVILDVLHYVTHAEQEDILQRARDALAPGGRLLLRVGDAGARRGFAFSQWVDRVAASLRGHAVPPTHARPLAAWVALLQGLDLRVTAQPMSHGTPFANVLLVAQRS
jgi:SAM-dependent methyltransferase